MARKKTPFQALPGQKYIGTDRDPWYVVGSVQDGEEEVVVVKSWAKYKQRWVYNAKPKESVLWEAGLMARERKADGRD